MEQTKTYLTKRTNANGHIVYAAIHNGLPLCPDRDNIEDARQAARGLTLSPLLWDGDRGLFVADVQTAEAIARLLEAHHIPVRSFKEGDDLTDGEVVISTAVHVQVPSLTAEPEPHVLVVRELPDGSFLFSEQIAPGAETLVAKVEEYEADAIRDLLRTGGFAETETGGGCKAYVQNKPGGGYVLITDSTDPVLPRFLADPVAVGWYDIDGTADGFTFHAPDVASGLRLARKDRPEETEEPTILDRAFHRVADPNDWKAPIHAVVHPSEKRLMRAAVIYYTATVPEFSPHPTKTGMLVMDSDGYRLGPAGDA